MTRVYKRKDLTAKERIKIYQSNACQPKWTRRKTNKLVKLWLAGNSITLIAKIMGCGRGSIGGKIRRLDLQ